MQVKQLYRFVNIEHAHRPSISRKNYIDSGPEMKATEFLL